jgi:integrase
VDTMPELFSRPDSPYWYARTTIEGRSVSRSTGIARSRYTKEAARKAADEIFALIISDANYRRGCSLNRAIDLAFTAPTTRWTDAATRKRYAVVSANILDDLGDNTFVLSDITPNWLRRQFAAWRLNRSRSELRLRLVVLSGVLEHAILTGQPGASEINPFDQVRGLVPPPPKVVPPKRALTLEQLSVLLDKSKHHPFWGPFLLVMIDTGMRHKELLGLKWSEVDLKDGVINLPAEREKARRGRTIPLSHAALNALKGVSKHPRFDAVWVSERSGRPLVNIETSWKNFKGVLGFSTLKLHDLRHTYATLTREAGMSREDRKNILGHSTDSAHDIYAKAGLKSLQQAANQFSIVTLSTQDERTSLSTEVKK